MMIGKFQAFCEGVTRTGISKTTNRPYSVATLYVDFGNKYPEKVDVFLFDPQMRPVIGDVVVPVSMSLDMNGRLRFDVEMSQAVAVEKKPVVPTQSTAPKATA